jgi:hypothetical protein
MRKIGDDNGFPSHLSLDLGRLCMGACEEFIQKTQLVDQFQGRGVDGVAAEVAQEIGVFLQDEYLDARSRQQKTQHHSRRPTADDDTWKRIRLGAASGLVWHGLFSLRIGSL